jgi:general secretion pathway protein M
MKAWQRAFPGARARVTMGLLALSLLTGLFFLGSELLWRYGWAYETLEQVEPRHARLSGLVAHEPQLRTAHEAARAQLAIYAHDENSSADRLGTELQQRTRRIAEASAMSVANSQILPVRTEAGIEQVQVMVTLEGDSESLRNFLLQLEAERPLLQVSAAVLQPSRGRGQGGRVLAQLTITALHLLP